MEEESQAMWTREEFATVRLFALQVGNTTFQLIQRANDLRHKFERSDCVETLPDRSECLSMLRDVERLHDYWTRHNPLPPEVLNRLSAILPLIRIGLRGDLHVLRIAIRDGEPAAFRFMEQVDELAQRHCPEEYLQDPLPDL
jgi:hypothetical protein